MLSVIRFVLLPAVLVTLCVSTGNALEPIRPTLRTQIVIEGDSLRLGDFFNPAGDYADTIVAYAPQPGRRAVFDANWLSRLASRYGLTWQPASRRDRTVVERLSTVITATEIADALADELKARGYGDEYELALNNQSLQLHIAADQPPTVEVSDLVVDRRTERVIATIAAPAGDPNAMHVKVNGRLYAVIEIPVPVRAMRPGEVIETGDLDWVRIRTSQLRSNMVSNPDELIGRTSRRPLRAGAPIRAAEVYVPAVVNKNDNVTMVYRTANMLLRASGRALESGSLGDTIPVRNHQSGMVVEANIIGPERVEAYPINHLAMN